MNNNDLAETIMQSLEQNQQFMEDLTNLLIGSCTDANMVLAGGWERCDEIFETQLELIGAFAKKYGINLGDACPEIDDGRYFIVSVTTIDGEKESNSQVKIAFFGDPASPQNIADALAIIYEKGLDKDPPDRQYFWFKNGSVRVKASAEEVSSYKAFLEHKSEEGEWDIADEDVPRAIAYKSGAPASEWWKPDEQD
jgi:hypothetical protein